MKIGNYNAAEASQLPATLPLRLLADATRNVTVHGRGTHAPNAANGRDNIDELRERFTQFVGETFFGQMIKAMRATVGKPAYFHGGRAEEVFQGQLDQKLAEHLTEASADKFAEPMFACQFPHLSKLAKPNSLDQLESLRRA